LQASLKAALDGIASALDIDDSRFLVEVASIEIDKDDPRVEIEIRAAN
jgi:Holliday junction resolvase RusA-like endonuclease